LQVELDKTQVYRTTVDLAPVPLWDTGKFVYFDYAIPDALGDSLEESYTIRDSAGGTIAANTYTLDVNTRRVTFTTDQTNQPRSLDCYTYDLNIAASAVWDQKAAYVWESVDWSSDNHNIKAEQEYQHCLERAAYYRKKAGAKAGRFNRIDENPDNQNFIDGAGYLGDVQLSNFRPSRSDLY
jgi:hypothetical protein